MSLFYILFFSKRKKSRQKSYFLFPVMPLHVFSVPNYAAYFLNARKYWRWTQINIIFGIRDKKYVTQYAFPKKTFLTKNRPVVPFNTVLESLSGVPLRSIFGQKVFFWKNILSNVVFIPDFEYDIYFCPSLIFPCV